MALVDAENSESYLPSGSFDEASFEQSFDHLKRFKRRFRDRLIDLNNGQRLDELAWNSRAPLAA